ncbi:MAG: hypothetical protein RBS37_00245 [Bacteroidales bacterium]|jgi:hypothetical protein|nr:hypothetical protein [Bacteroidales bacterium]
MKIISSYRGRFVMALIASVVLIILIYQCGIKKTVTEVRTNRELTARFSWLKDIQKKMSEFEPYIQLSDSSAEWDMNWTSGSHERLLSKVATYVGVNNVKLVEFPAENISASDQLVIRTSRFTCSGSFYELLKFIDFLERDRSSGKIRSADFFLYTDRRSRVSELRLSISIENLSQSN